MGFFGKKPKGDRYRGKGAGSEEGTHDWLTSGIEGEARPSEWLAGQPLPKASERAAGGGAQAKRAPEPEPVAPEPEPEPEPVAAAAVEGETGETGIIFWITLISLGVAIFTGLTHGVTATRSLLEVGVRALLTGALVWGGLLGALWFLGMFLTHVLRFRVILPLLGGASVGATAVNPHCLDVLEENPVESAVCVGLSSLESDLDLSTGAAGGMRTIEDRHEDASASSPYVFLVSELGDGGQAQALNGRGEARFHDCMETLYEDPAKLIESRAMVRFQFDHEVSHGIALDSLLAVCERYRETEIRDLNQYYWRTATNAMKWKKGRDSWELKKWKEAAVAQGCVASSERELTEAQLLLVELAIEELPTKNRVVLRRYLEGGSFEEIARDLGIERRQAYDDFAYGKRKIGDALEKLSCQLMDF